MKIFDVSILGIVEIVFINSHRGGGRPPNSHDIVVCHTISGLISRFHHQPVTQFGIKMNRYTTVSCDKSRQTEHWQSNSRKCLII